MTQRQAAGARSLPRIPSVVHRKVRKARTTSVTREPTATLVKPHRPRRNHRRRLLCPPSSCPCSGIGGGILLSSSSFLPSHGSGPSLNDHGSLLDARPAPDMGDDSSTMVMVDANERLRVMPGRAADLL